MFCSSLDECLVHLQSLVHLVGRNFLNLWLTAFGAPCVFLHKKNVDEGVEVGAAFNGVLDGHNLRAIDADELFQELVEVAVLVVKLVDEEDDGLAELLRVAEVVLRANLHTCGTLEQDECCVGHVQRSNSGTCEVITAWTVNEVNLLAVPFYMANRGEDRIAVFMLYGEIVADGRVQTDSAATLDDTCLVEHGFSQCRLACSVVA